MTTEAKFKNALRELMKTTSIDDISVTLLCQKCGCHRQTFYYHYQDIYDLIADILLNEKLDEFDQAKDIKSSMVAFINYGKANLAFFHATYISSAHDLPDDFIYGKFRTKFLTILTKNKKKLGLEKVESCRTISRRYARIVSDEFGDCFKENKITPDKFVKKMTKYIDISYDMLFPSIIEMVKAESKLQ